MSYTPVNKVRIVTAASLFDGHDAAINIMRRIIQATGVEVIHLGHDRSVEDVVNTAIQEDAQSIAFTNRIDVLRQGNPKKLGSFQKYLVNGGYAYLEFTTDGSQEPR